MISRKLGLLIDRYSNYINLDVSISDGIKIPEPTINKALMIAMNYLIENVVTEEQEEPE